MTLLVCAYYGCLHACSLWEWVWKICDRKALLIQGTEQVPFQSSTELHAWWAASKQFRGSIWDGYNNTTNTHIKKPYPNHFTYNSSDHSWRRHLLTYCNCRQHNQTAKFREKKREIKSAQLNLKSIFLQQQMLRGFICHPWKRKA